MNKILSKYETIKKIKTLYGRKAVVRAVYNKITGNPIMYRVQKSALTRDEIGREIVKEQQIELSKEEIIFDISKMKLTPKISIIMPIYNAPLKWLKIALQSIKNQYYDNWELCAVNDGSSEREGIEFLKSLESDKIKVIDVKENNGISAASNKALEIATGEYFVLMDQDDEITKDALFWIVKKLNEFPKAEFIYTDECKIDGNTGTELSYFICKPDWSPEMMINQMYTGHLTMYKTETVRQIGGFRSEYDFSQDYDLALRMSKKTTEIYHVERILYFWRAIPTSSAAGGKDYARETNINALGDYLLEQGLSAELIKGPYANIAYLQLKYNYKASIIVPSDSCENMERTVNGILECTEYDNYEVILVTNSNAIKEMKTRVTSEKVVYCLFDRKYNFSDKCNEGAAIASGDIVIFYNDDVIPRENTWLRRMLEVFEIENVGGVAPMLVYENDMIQYAGMISGVRGQVGTSFHMQKYDIVDYWYNQFLLRNVSVLSGACVALRKTVFEQINKFDEIHTPSAHSDVDLSYKLLEKGYRCVYTPYAIMTHIGNHSWEVKSIKEKSHIYCLKRWGNYISEDKYFTETMKKLFYYTSDYNYYICTSEKEKYKYNTDTKDILFVTHELTSTGAPIQLYNMIKNTYEKMNYFPVIVSPTDGALKKAFLDLGATVIIDQELLLSAVNFDTYARNYDLIVVNTMAPICIDIIKNLKNTLPPILWWVHEGYYAFGLFKKYLRSLKLYDNIHLYCASEYSKKMLEEYSSVFQSEILRCGVEEFEEGNNNTETTNNSKCSFVIVGSIEWRKGQDIVLSAIKKLPDNVRKQIEVYFIGQCNEKKLENKIKKASEEYSCVKYIGELSRGKLFQYYQNATAVIVPSRDEPTSLVAIEGMMLLKPAIVSSKVGVSSFITHKENGFLFENENIKQLSDIMQYVVENQDECKKIGNQAFKLYEKNYKKEIFAKECEKVLKKYLR